MRRTTRPVAQGDDGDRGVAVERDERVLAVGVQREPARVGAERDRRADAARARARRGSSVPVAPPPAT